jgi:hypothetical protein
LQRIATVKGAPNPKIVQPKQEPIERTSEAQAKYDAEQTDWHLRMGKQHKKYNPEGVTVWEARA